jgi:hypothetical protein
LVRKRTLRLTAAPPCAGRQKRAPASPDLCRAPYGGKLDQETITGGFDDMTLVGGDRLLDDLVMSSQQAQGAGFVRAYLAAKAYHVGEHNGR